MVYFRPNKKWDLLVVDNNELVIAIEFKSQVGPSFGNNFNNRTEEAMGSAVGRFIQILLYLAGKSALIILIQFCGIRFQMRHMKQT